ncbi:hypothetical protein GGF46_003818 [Coemansia sp. RSA 552]|nr:hypothetical protein GGF46_003818 [Coemansia sp. RSA 552]
MFLNTLLFLYVLWNRNYKPLKAKNIRLISVLYLSMMIWGLGTLGTDFNLKDMFDFPGSCLLFGLWFRILVGTFMFIFVHILRLYIYIRIFKRFQRVTLKVYVVATVIYLVFILSFGIPISILRSKLTIVFAPQLSTCIYGTVFIELSFAIVWAGWLAILIITYSARNINTSFKEYREMLLIVFLGSTSIVYQSVIHHIVQDFTVHRWTRVTSAFVEYVASQTSLVILLWTPVYNCMFHREEFQRRFFEKMQADGMSARYGLTLPSSGVLPPMSRTHIEEI